MKVCILSMQRVPNFGSLLQSYALKQLLEQMGHTVSFLDIERCEQDDALLHPGKCAQAKSRIHGVIAKLKKIDRYALNRINIKVLAKKQNEKFEAFRRDKLLLDKNANTERYDCCVIGSDEVFNCLTDASWGFTSQLFGNVPQADRVITYAASCGATEYDALPDEVAKKIAEAFENVAAFSVRDRNTKEFVSRLSPKAVQQNADPVMISDFTRQIDACPMPKGLPRRYCVVYSYYNRISDPQEICQIKAFCKANRLVPVTVGAPQMWIPRHLALTPIEALKVFRNAQFVITDTFHGTIFSAKYTRAFAVMTRKSNENKLADLLERFGLQKHRVKAFGQIENIADYQVNTDAVKVAAEKEREHAGRYLLENIQ